MKPRLFPCALFLFLLFAAPAGAQTRTVHLASLEWPPFAGEDLPGGGTSAQTVRAAFAAAGYDVKIDYLPWARAIESLRAKTDYDGLFPAYENEVIGASLTLSAPFDTSPLALAEFQKTRPWTHLPDLAAYTIGTVESYVNTVAFDTLAAQGKLRVEPCSDDETNLRKLAGGRIDMAVIDAAVFRYLVDHTPDLAPQSASFRLNPRVLADKDLFIGFRKDAQGAELAELFAKGLAQIRTQKPPAPTSTP